MTKQEFENLKPGDIIVGNKYASKRYSITRSGVYCVVERILDKEKTRIRVYLKDVPYCPYTVDAMVFDVVNSTKEISDQEIIPFLTDLM
jgi:hypothetical protein